MFGGIGILLLFLVAGEALAGIGVPLPGNVIGMILITLALATGRLSLARVERAAATLLDNLAFFFVPPAVGVIVHAGLLGRNILAITVAVTAAAVIVFVTTGLSAQAMIRFTEKRSGESHGS
ncbi:MAG: CidA/LrgA family protein [Spirochaetaceae bacterium]|nr:MAG: CidA/LrgA family protein [Spirochaetaceae bacterium]